MPEDILYNGKTYEQYQNGDQESVKVTDGEEAGNFGWIIHTPEEVEQMNGINVGERSYYLNMYTGKNKGLATFVPEAYVKRAPDMSQVNIDLTGYQQTASISRLRKVVASMLNGRSI